MPIPHDERHNCGMPNCKGVVTFSAGNWSCDSCDFVLSDEEMNSVDMFVRHLEDQYPSLTGDDIAKLQDEMNDE